MVIRIYIEGYSKLYTGLFENIYRIIQNCIELFKIIYGYSKLYTGLF